MERLLEDEYGYVLGDKVYLKSYLDFPDREIGEVRLSLDTDFFFI